MANVEDDRYSSFLRSLFIQPKSTFHIPAQPMSNPGKRRHTQAPAGPSEDESPVKVPRCGNRTVTAVLRPVAGRRSTDGGPLPPIELVSGENFVGRSIATHCAVQHCSRQHLRVVVDLARRIAVLSLVCLSAGMRVLWCRQLILTLVVALQGAKAKCSSQVDGLELKHGDVITAVHGTVINLVMPKPEMSDKELKSIQFTLAFYGGGDGGDGTAAASVTSAPTFSSPSSSHPTDVGGPTFSAMHDLAREPAGPQAVVGETGGVVSKGSSASESRLNTATVPYPDGHVPENVGAAAASGPDRTMLTREPSCGGKKATVALGPSISREPSAASEQSQSANQPGFPAELLDIAQHPESYPSDVIHSDELVVVLRHRHPRAAHHYLVLPRVPIAGIAELAGCAEAEALLIAMHEVAGLLIEQLNTAIVASADNTASDFSRLTRGAAPTFRTGFFAQNVGSQLHMHVISEDFCKVKSKKQWNQFTTCFFMGSADVMKKVLDGAKLTPLSDAEATALLNRIPACHICSKYTIPLPRAWATGGNSANAECMHCTARPIFNLPTRLSFKTRLSRSHKKQFPR